MKKPLIKERMIKALNFFSKPKKPTNDVYAISAYFHDGFWVFDDESRGLDKEPFVEGADILMDHMSGRVTDKSKDEVRFYFAKSPLPGFDVKLTKYKVDGYDGTYYFVDFPAFDIQKEGPIWLCPALLKFFNKAPKNIYVKIK